MSRINAIPLLAALALSPACSSDEDKVLQEEKDFLDSLKDKTKERIQDELIKRMFPEETPREAREAKPIEDYILPNDALSEEEKEKLEEEGRQALTIQSCDSDASSDLIAEMEKVYNPAFKEKVSTRIDQLKSEYQPSIAAADLYGDNSAGGAKIYCTDLDASFEGRSVLAVNASTPGESYWIAFTPAGLKGKSPVDAECTAQAAFAAILSCEQGFGSHDDCLYYTGAVEPKRMANVPFDLIAPAVYQTCWCEKTDQC